MAAPNIIRNINALKEVLTASGDDTLIIGKKRGRSAVNAYEPRLILLETLTQYLASDPDLLDSISEYILGLLEGENVGTGVEVFKELVDCSFKFHTLVEGTGITLTLNETTGEITIDSTGGGGGGTFTNLDPTPVAVGGYPAGTTFDNVDYPTFAQGLMYPYQEPALTLSSSLFKTYETGEFVPSGIQSINYTVSNSANIKAQPPNVGVPSTSIVGATFPVDPIELLPAGSFDIDIPLGTSLSSPGTKNISLQGTNSNDDTFSKTGTLTFRDKRYWGTAAFFGNPSNAAIIAADGAGVGAGNEFSTTRVQSRNGIDGGGRYLFFSWQTSFGTPTFVVNGLPNTAWTKVGDAFTFFNSNANPVTYDTWMSNTQQNSPIATFQIT